MKNKILKILTIVLLAITLTMTNFIYVGVGLVSYAASTTQTNHQNVEFGATLKENNILLIEINVKKEGYFNGKINLENSNFELKKSESQFVQKIEDNTITLNQINSGTSAQIEVEIEPVKEEIFDTGLLNAVSKLTLTGTYCDSTEKNITIKAEREVTLEYTENNQTENIENTIETITNKLVTIEGEEKRVVQLSVNMGLKENNYPIKKISTQISVPSIDGKQPTIVKKIDFNTMTHYDYNYDGSKVEITYTNEPNANNLILWKKQGNEKAVITLIYDKDVSVENLEMQAEEKVTLYNNKELQSTSKIVLANEEKDAMLQIEANSQESTIYKGKLNAGLDREYKSITNIAVNLANAEENLTIKENTAKYIVDQKEIEANVVYSQTILAKEEFDKIFGQNGTLTILNEKGETIATVNNASKVDEEGNIVIDYTGKESTAIEIKTTTPVAEGNLKLTHTKIIKEQNKEVIKNATELSTKISCEYNSKTTNTVENKIKLEESKTETTLEINKSTLSTVVENNVEIRATLKANQEQYNLYKNPTININLPEDTVGIKINSLDLIYEDELKIKSCEMLGATLTINLEGEQTKYKEAGIEGAIVVLNANITVNRKAATKDSQIVMTCQNEETIVSDTKAIRIVAQKDMTVINSIKELNVETMGQEETRNVSIQRATDSKQLETEIEVINNNESAIENVKIMGTFPTKNKENNIDIKVLEGINVQGIENSKVYYTEKADATQDIQNSENGWKETIEDSSKVQKYLIEIPTIKAQASVKGTYKIEVPALLEYNQTAKQGYQVTYINSETKTTSEMKATTLVMQTGVGPKLETKLTSTIGGNEATTVRNGEVITYKVEVSNVGSEDLSDITVEGNVPDGTTLVKPQDNYEYTGASYYQELADKTYTDKIDTLKVGEVITKEYEVRVNKGVEAGTKLANTVQVKYGDVTKTTNESQLNTMNGDIRVSVKRVTDRNVELYEAGAIQYFAIIENISDKKQNNVKVKTNLPETLEVSRLTLITGMESEEISDNDIYEVGSNAETQIETREIKEDELAKENTNDNVKTEELEYKDELNIGSLEAGEVKVLSYDMVIQKLTNSNPINFSVSVKNGNDEYQSNTLADQVKKAEIALDMTANTQTKYLKTGDIVEYTITIKNNGTERIEGITLKDTIPSSLSVNKVSFDEEEIEQLKGKNEIEISCDIAANTESKIKIETVVNHSEARIEAEPITNVAYAELLGEKIATTPEVDHIIQANQTEGNNSGSGENNSNEVENNDIANGSKMITGVAWFDDNADGRKDDNEKTLSGIKVHLLNTKTNNLVRDEKGNTLEATTNENGLYVLNNIGNGDYIVVFEYDNTYTLTKYKANEIEETKNSNAMMNELLIGNEKQKVASTDIIKINNDNIEDINIGLIKAENFDLKLDKYVSKILIQNSAGTIVREYNNETLAKAELDAKKVNGTTVIIEYKIVVSNVGEVDGYAKKIVDYIPNDLKFSSELNKDWYQTGDGLYNASLANDKIAAGETKEITLTLTKAMTEGNTGRTNNTAEIAEDYNELGITDSNSTPKNKTQGENDMGSADVILSIKTGGAIWITTIVVIVALGITAFIIIRKKIKNADKKI